MAPFLYKLAPYELYLNCAIWSVTWVDIPWKKNGRIMAQKGSTSAVAGGTGRGRGTVFPRCYCIPMQWCERTGIHSMERACLVSKATFTLVSFKAVKWQ